MNAGNFTQMFVDNILFVVAGMGISFYLGFLLGSFISNKAIKELEEKVKDGH